MFPLGKILLDTTYSIPCCVSCSLLSDYTIPENSATLHYERYPYTLSVRNTMSRPVSYFRRFLWKMFEENHKYKFTDEQLCSIVRRHFPNSKLDVSVGRHKNRLAIWRSEYNRGRMFFQPSKRSVSYVSTNVESRPANSNRSRHLGLGRKE